jgi:hypothetical protein
VRRAWDSRCRRGRRFGVVFLEIIVSVILLFLVEIVLVLLVGGVER